jgi:uncharacterized damage-inducible protein DinB
MDSPVIDEHGRVEPPLAGDEVATLFAYLDYHRATLRWKCEGLDAEALSRTVASSSLTLGGLLKHMALVEESWFSERLLGRELGSPWDAVDWDADRDWDFHSAPDDSPVELLDQWQRSVAIARAGVAEALASGGLDQPIARGWPDGRTPSLRWVVVHMSEEYARHNGHADLLREAIDGETGE